MARYIDADKLIAEYDRVHEGPAGGARKLMVEAPTADVAEVVRCEKCKFYEEVEYYHPTENATKKVCRLLQRQMHPNDWCSYAKRSDTK